MINLPEDYQVRPDLLAGHTVLITGAGDGLGRAAALASARHGATVILLGRTVAKLEKVYDEITAAGGAQPAIYPMDLLGAAEKDYDELGAVIQREFGQLDGLLHNAAILGQHAPIVHCELETWLKVFQINLHAPFLLSRACYPALNAAGAASVVFTSDISALHGSAYGGAYSASKAAAENLMQMLADEWEVNTRIRVNSLDPGPVNTALRRNIFPGIDPDQWPLPDAVMPAYLYLLGPDSREHSGQHLKAQPNSEAP
jgi:NAD(P)-dependent dehydrogenase (short-subunit alcohol dehydrogenase family)